MYDKSKKQSRPDWLKKRIHHFKPTEKHQESSSSSLFFHWKGSGDQNALIVRCKRCNSSRTPIWRKNPQKQTICNACYVYYRLHGTYRPLYLVERQNRKEKELQRKSKHYDAEISNKQAIGCIETSDTDSETLKQHYSSLLSFYPPLKMKQTSRSKSLDDIPYQVPPISKSRDIHWLLYGQLHSTPKGDSKSHQQIMKLDYILN